MKKRLSKITGIDILIAVIILFCVIIFAAGLVFEYKDSIEHRKNTEYCLDRGYTAHKELFSQTWCLGIRDDILVGIKIEED